MKNILLSIVLVTITFSICFSQPIVQWQKSLGGTSNENAFSIEQTSDHGYIVCGESDSQNGDITNHHGSTDCWVVKLDQAGNIQWQHSYGGSAYDRGNSIRQTKDGGYIVACECTSNDGDVTGNHGGSDFWVFKLDSAGNMLWEHSYGGSGNEYAYSIQQTKDLGFIVAGYTDSNDGDVSNSFGNGDYWLVKLDTVGNIVWENSYGGTDYDLAHAVMQTFDKGYIIGGWSHSNDVDVTGHHGSNSYCDAWIVKVDSVGNLQWQNSVGGSYDDGVYTIVQAKNLEYIVSGWTDSNDGDIIGNHGGTDYWIAKLSLSGSLLFEKPFGGSSNDVAYSVHECLLTGGYIAAGYSKSSNGNVSLNHGNNDAWIVKLDTSCNILWQISLGGSGDDAGYSIFQTSDGGFVYAGWNGGNSGNVTGNHGSSDFWVVKLGYTTDIESISENKSVVIYPNPAKNQILLKNVPENTFLIFYSVDKKAVKSCQFDRNGIDISDLPPGYYTISLSNSTGISYKSFIKN